MFDRKRFFEESWPKISQGFATEADAEAEIGWILRHVRPPAGARVLDAPCGFGRHSLALARRGFQVTGVDLSETELGRARERAQAARLTLDLVRRDMGDMEFSGEFDLDTRNRDHFIRHYPGEELVAVPGGTVLVKNTFDFTTSRVRQDWWLEGGQAPLDQLEIRFYSAHELHRMLRPERWSDVALFGGLDGRPSQVDSPRLVLVATK